MATGYELDEYEFDSRQGQESFLYSSASKTVLGFTQPLI